MLTFTRTSAGSARDAKTHSYAAVTQNDPSSGSIASKAFRLAMATILACGLMLPTTLTFAPEEAHAAESVEKTPAPETEGAENGAWGGVIDDESAQQGDFSNEGEGVDAEGGDGDATEPVENLDSPSEPSFFDGIAAVFMSLFSATITGTPSDNIIPGGTTWKPSASDPLTISTLDGSQLEIGKDIVYTSGNVKYRDNSYTTAGGNRAGATVTNVVEIMTSKPLRISTGSGTSHIGIQINEGVSADITFDNVSINHVAPLNMITNKVPGSDNATSVVNNALAYGTPADVPTKLHLTLADGSNNTLTTPLNNTGTAGTVLMPGIRCGYGSELTIDDGLRNVDVNTGQPIQVEGGKVKLGAGGTAKLPNNKVVNDGDVATCLDTSGVLGKLTVYGNRFCSGIGGGNRESSGHITFNGGEISSTARGEEANDDNAGAGIGGGNNGGSFLTFNGGKITAQGAYHGAGIGSGYGYVTNLPIAPYTPDAIYNVTNRDNNISGTYWIAAGNIYINGGYLQSYGGSHGNGFGQGCFASNIGGLIKITGGTLLPHGATSEARFKDIGGNGGYVIITGGSVNCKSDRFQGLGDTAYNTQGIDTFEEMAAADRSGDKVFMITSDLSGEPNRLTTEPVVDFDLSIAGFSDLSYGSPSYFDAGKLYLWLPSIISGQHAEVRMDVSVSKDGEVVTIDPLYVGNPTVNGKNMLQTYITFTPFPLLPEACTDESDPEFRVASKEYDGTPLLAYGYGEGGFEPFEGTSNAGTTVSFTNRDLLSYKYAYKDGVNAGAVSKSGATVLPFESGQYAITMTSTENADASKTYLGFSTEGSAHIDPTGSLTKTTLYDSTGQPVGGDAIDIGMADQPFSINVDLVTGYRNGTEETDTPIRNADTCAAPTGYIEIWVGDKLVRTLKLDVPGRLQNEDFKVGDTYTTMKDYPDADETVTATVENVTEADGKTYKHTRLAAPYTITPSEVGDWWMGASGEMAQGEDSPSFTVRTVYRADKNYNPSEDSVSVSFEPIEPDVEVYDPADPDPEFDPPADDPEAPNPGKPVFGDGEDGSPNTEAWMTRKFSDYSGADESGNPKSDVLELNIVSDAGVDADISSSNDKVAYVGEDGKVHIVGCGDTDLTLVFPATPTRKSTTRVIHLKVLPDETIKPEVTLAKTAKVYAQGESGLVAREDGAARPGDVIEYTVTATNWAQGSSWQHVLIRDVLQEGLVFVPNSVTAANGLVIGTTYDLDAELKTVPVAPGPADAPVDPLVEPLAADGADPAEAVEDANVPAGVDDPSSDAGGGAEGGDPDAGGSGTGSDDPDAGGAGDNADEGDAEGYVPEKGKYWYDQTLRELLVAIDKVDGGHWAAVRFQVEVPSDIGGRADIEGGLAFDNVAKGEGGHMQKPEPTDDPNPEPVFTPDPPVEGGLPEPTPVVPDAPEVGPGHGDDAGDLVVTKTFSVNGGGDNASVKVGDSITYTITVENRGPVNSCWENVVIRDSLPKGLTYEPGTLVFRDVKGDWHEVDSDKTYELVDNTIAVNAGDLYGGEVVQMVFVAKVNDAALDTTEDNIGNTAQAYGGEPKGPGIPEGGGDTPQPGWDDKPDPDGPDNPDGPGGNPDNPDGPDNPGGDEPEKPVPGTPWTPEPDPEDPGKDPWKDLEDGGGVGTDPEDPAKPDEVLPPASNDDPGPNDPSGDDPNGDDPNGNDPNGGDEPGSDDPSGSDGPSGDDPNGANPPAGADGSGQGGASGGSGGGNPSDAADAANGKGQYLGGVFGKTGDATSALALTLMVSGGLLAVGGALCLVRRRRKREDS